MDRLQRAIVHELHGDIRRDAGYDNANDSYVEALTYYSQAKEFEKSNSRDAADGMSRVTVKIAKLNEEEQVARPTVAGGNGSTGPPSASPTAVPAALPPTTPRM